MIARQTGTRSSIIFSLGTKRNIWKLIWMKLMWFSFNFRYRLETPRKIFSQSILMECSSKFLSNVNDTFPTHAISRRRNTNTPITRSYIAHSIYSFPITSVSLSFSLCRFIRYSTAYWIGSLPRVAYSHSIYLCMISRLFVCVLACVLVSAYVSLSVQYAVSSNSLF